MTRDELITIARAVGFILSDRATDEAIGRFARFAALVAAAEREACAKVCEQTGEDGEGPDCWGWRAKDYARAIRQRGAA